jgi:hypothetical protein
MVAALYRLVFIDYPSLEYKEYVQWLKHSICRESILCEDGIELHLLGPTRVVGLTLPVVVVEVVVDDLTDVVQLAPGT